MTIRGSTVVRILIWSLGIVLAVPGSFFGAMVVPGTIAVDSYQFFNDADCKTAQSEGCLVAVFHFYSHGSKVKSIELGMGPDFGSDQLWLTIRPDSLEFNQYEDTPIESFPNEGVLDREVVYDALVIAHGESSAVKAQAWSQELYMLIDSLQSIGPWVIASEGLAEGGIDLESLSTSEQDRSVRFYPRSVPFFASAGAIIFVCMIAVMFLDRTISRRAIRSSSIPN